jgi:hypothetical protein
MLVIYMQILPVFVLLYLRIKYLNNHRTVILFISDGTFTQGQDPRTVIRDENMKLQNRAVIFTYLLGPGK